MIVDCVLDTNILLYAVSRNQAHRSKKTKAIDLIESERFGVSTQILQEFYVNATRKADFAMSSEAAIEWIENLEEVPCRPVDIALVKNAIIMCEQYRISYWDGAVVAATEALGAPTLYTEDLSHGQSYGSVTVINPFIDISTERGAVHEPDPLAFRRNRPSHRASR